MRRIKSITLIIGLCLLSGVIAGGIGCFIRAEYDKMFMLEGWFHVINATDDNLDVQLLFPSGYQMKFELKSNSSKNFVLHNTGEGGIFVTVNQKYLGNFGYVTSMNSIVILTIDHERVGFSQIFPSLKPEQVTGADVKDTPHS